jgi:predicted DNA-binding transcriptional regulator AlpA
MSKYNQLARLPPAVAAQLEELKDTIGNLGVELAAAFAVQAEQKAEREPERERLEPATNIVADVPSATRGFRAREVAERLCVNPQTLWRWVRQGRFPKGTQIGPARTIWTEQTIAEWLDEQRANPGKRRPLPRDRLKRERLGRE